jgi:hypothetical protein
MRRVILVALVAGGLSGCLQADPEAAQRMMMVGAALRGTGAAMQQANPPMTMGRSQMMCIKTSEFISGMNKVCSYNCGGSAAAQTVGAADLCPDTVG